MLDFARIMLIARREWRSRVRERSFRVATIVSLVLVIAAACLPTIIAAFSDGGGDDVTTVGVIDTANASIVERMQPMFATAAGDGKQIQLIAADFLPDEAASQIDDGKVDAVLSVTRAEDQELQFGYVNEDGTFDATAQQIYAGAAAISVEDRLQRTGASSDQIAAATAPPAFSVVEGTASANPDDTSTTDTELLIAFITIIVMFLAIQLYGNWIAQGVVEEKNSRIMEIMINAATPRDLLGGKVLGIGLAAMTQLLPLLILGGLAFALQPRIADMFGIEKTSTFDEIEFGSLSARIIVAFLAYFIFGFILYASLYAGVASMLSRQEDVSQAVAPLTMVMMGGYISAFFSIPEPDSLFARVLSIVPFTSPFNMVPRLVLTDVPAWELALSFALLVVAAVAGILLAGRIYRVGVLMYGQKASVKAIFARNLQGTSR